MSRPTKSESERLEAMESAAALLAEMDVALDVLERRLAHLKHRASPRLLSLFQAVEAEVSRVEEKRGGAREYLHRALAIGQRKRREDNRG